MTATQIRFTALALLIAISIHGHGQETQKNHIKELIASKMYQFRAQSARTAKGKTIQLTNDYFLEVNKDSLDAYLPYYGQAFSASYSSTDQGIQFKSTNFTYTVDSAKKGGWDITIIPKNEPKASKINLSLSSTGYCNVSVLSNMRQQISFYGTVEAIKK